jgi:hypothetical protein
MESALLVIVVFVVGIKELGRAPYSNWNPYKYSPEYPFPR